MKAMKTSSGIKVEIRPLADASSSRVVVSGVWLQGRLIGLLEKWTDTRTTTNPWKVKLGFGAVTRHLGAFYKQDGGKQAAIDRLVESAGAAQLALDMIYTDAPDGVVNDAFIDCGF